MKITDHPHYDSLRAYKKAHEIDLMQEYSAHGIGIRWENNASENSADDADQNIALAVYLGSPPEQDSKIPVSIMIQDVNGTGVLRISVQTIISPQASFD